ncbi:MAG: (d)CMP kinase [Phycisphaerae bacterium]|nr:(d)CMP kinase [Phycisphaerae bacterium]
MIITIDGPAGSGKSTAARKLAEALQIAYLDTGATYRAITLLALRRKVSMDDEAALIQLARDADIHLIPAPDAVRVLLDGKDVSDDIRSPEVSDNSHYIARSPGIRKVLVKLQRKLGAELGDFVSEGRDQGSVVFPDADIKFYIVASPEVRARRRCEELIAAGQDVVYEQILKGIIERDRRDSTRATAPLTKPDGAVEINTTSNTVEQTAEQLLTHVEQQR